MIDITKPCKDCDKFAKGYCMKHLAKVIKGTTRTIKLLCECCLKNESEIRPCENCDVRCEGQEKCQVNPNVKRI